MKFTTVRLEFIWKPRQLSLRTTLYYTLNVAWTPRLWQFRLCTTTRPVEQRNTTSSLYESHLQRTTIKYY